MDPDDQAAPERELGRPSSSSDEYGSRLRRTAKRLHTNPSLLGLARRIRKRLPGDERFGDPLSTAGRAPIQVIARGVSALGMERESVVQEVGMTALQLWQSLSEAAGRGRGDVEIALLFTDLVGFSSWALRAGDAATIELLREVGTVEEKAVLSHGGRIVKRLGDGLMATFLDAGAAIDAALDARDGLQSVEVSGYRPRMRAGVHWGRPRKLGGDYIGVDVNIAARVADAAKAGQVMVSETALARIDFELFDVSRLKRLRAAGAPRDMRIAPVSPRSIT